MTGKKKVLIIDDSIMVRRVLQDIINSTDDMEVIGTAADPYEAREIIKNIKPDVITLDVEMPKMDGITFLDKLMRAMPTPVVMISSMTHDNAEVTMKALDLGAVDYIPKPSQGVFSSLEEIAEEIVEKLRAALTIPPEYLEKHKLREKMVHTQENVLDSNEIAIIKKTVRFSKLFPVIAIGASTGGTVAIEYLLRRLNIKVMPPIVIVQHIPPLFSKSFADRLNNILDFNVIEGVDGHQLRNGDVVIAPGGKHMMIERIVSGYTVLVKDGPKINRHKPSVDVLFKSVANSARESAVGIILTGMGSDGSRGMMEMKRNSSFNIAQVKEGCAVYSMPRAAVEIGAIDIELSLDGIANYINRIFEGNF